MRKDKITVRVNNKLIVQDAPQAVYQWCYDHLKIDNPDYYKKQRLGKWVGNTPRDIFLYERVRNDIWMPFGCLQELHERFGAIIQYEVEIKPISRVLYNSHINLYPYQKEAVEAVLEAKNGVLVMPCGSGKTQCGLEIISRIGGKALWLTHTQDLLNQSKKRAESVLLQGGYGSITAGKVNIGMSITFATIQTMCKLDLTAYRNEWDVIIVDECQHCCGSPTRVTQFYKVLSNLSARYKIGLTATPKRSDGLEKAMFALLGNVIHEVSKEAVKDTTCPIHVISANTGYEPDINAVLMGDGTLNYTELLNDLINNAERFRKVADYVNQIGRSTLVLASRVQYIQDLQKAFKGRSICLSTLGQSKKAKEERKEALKKLNSGEIDAIFATYQLAKEGLDVPSLQYVIFATPEKDETTVIQSAGRVGRKAEGKNFGTVIDFVDNFGMYRGWAKKRQRYYKKIGAEIIEN